MAAKVEQQLCILCILRDPFKLFGEEDGEHCLSLARTARYLEKLCTAVQPGLVDIIFSDPFAGTSDPVPFRAYEAFSIDGGIGEEESIPTGADFLIKGFCRSVVVSDPTRQSILRQRSIQEL
jgi:hypothetical protein